MIKHDKAGLRLLDWHESITTSTLIKEFNSGSGMPIQVYDISHRIPGPRIK